jgi:hypothetical protein
MGDTHHDPTDHSRTHHQHAGESMIDVYFMPGLILIAVSIVALVGCLAAAATHHSEWLLATGLTAGLSAVAGAAWLIVERHRVRRAEAEWLAAHPAERSRRPAA